MPAVQDAAAGQAAVVLESEGGRSCEGLAAHPGDKPVGTHGAVAGAERCRRSPNGSGRRAPRPARGAGLREFQWSLNRRKSGRPASWVGLMINFFSLGMT